ncbi:FUSC family protein [Paenibacillus sp. XY044]|uniref:FUSC family protein n=1 Tax=Paenibacillus sp. XY044 TaxID=2026089 RepID=UPI0015C66825|nr:FUSC family protein [Paenibacillus sp. XY044]
MIRCRGGIEVGVTKKQRPFLSRTIRQAFEVKKVALPWNRALSAGLCIGLPSLIGFWLGQFQYGMLAGTGGFAYLYVASEPYALRAQKVLLAALGLTFSVAAGTLLASYPLLAAFVLGCLGAAATYLFGVLKFKGPGALFFVLSFTLATGMPPDPSQAFSRGGLVFLGGMLAWCFAMAGWLIRPHGPEIGAVRQLYLDLGAMMDVAGTREYSRARHQTLLSMYSAETALATGGHNRHGDETPRRLSRMYSLAHHIYLLTDKIPLADGERLPPELSAAVRRAGESCGQPDTWKKAPLPDDPDPQILDLMDLVAQLDAIVCSSASDGEQGRKLTRIPVRSILAGNLDKDSIVFLQAIRFGVILMVAAAAAYAFQLNRSYWVPLSCASVMLGATVIATFHRAIQRSLGTIFGILIASAILWTRPEGFVVSIAIILFTFFTELFIVRNYALAMLFITPNALLMAETNTRIHNFGYFAGARLTDVLVGSVIGLIGVLLVGSRSASSRIPYLLGRTIRSQAQFLALLFIRQPAGAAAEQSAQQRSMRRHLSNLRTVYQTALGEIPRSEEELEKLLPVIWSLDQFGYVLNSYALSAIRPVLPDVELGVVLLHLEKMAQSAEQRREIEKGPEGPDGLELPLVPDIGQELADLRHALNGR